MLPIPIKLLTYGRLSKELYRFLAENPVDELQCVHAESKEGVLEKLPDCNAIAGFNFLKRKEIGHLKWIHSFGAGVDSFLELPNLPERIIMTRTSGNLGKKIGEYCLAYLLHDLKQIDQTAVQQQKACWNPLFLPNLYDQEVVIFGTGTIGQGIAEILHPLVKSVIGVNRSGNDHPAFTKVLPLEKGIQSISENCVVINALPLSPGTRHFFNANVFSTWANVLFINIGRGGSVSNRDVLEGLGKGNLRKAVLDVFEQEPLPETSPFWQHPKVSVTPHHSGLTTADDVISSFTQVFRAIQHHRRNHLFVDLEKGY